MGVGRNGKILKTTNAGTNWISQSSGTSNELFSVYFTNLNIGFAVGSNGTILKTNDSGVNWNNLTKGKTANSKLSSF